MEREQHDHHHRPPPPPPGGWRYTGSRGQGGVERAASTRTLYGADTPPLSRHKHKRTTHVVRVSKHKPYSVSTKANKSNTSRTSYIEITNTIINKNTIKLQYDTIKLIH